MSLSLKNSPFGLALLGQAAWDAPASDMGMVSDGGGGQGGDEPPDTPTDPEDAADPDSESHEEKPDDADASPSARASDDDADDDADDDEDADLDDGRPLDERFRKVLKSKRKIERQLRTLKPHAPLLKQLRDAGLNLSDLVSSHQQLQALQQRMAKNPKLKDLFGTEDGDEGGKPRRAAATTETEFPFDTSTKSGQFFKDFIESSRALQDQILDRLEQLDSGFKQDRTERTTQQTQATVTQWRAATDAAMKQLPKPFQALFNNVVGLEMRRALRGEITATPQQVIDFYLKDIRKNNGLGAAPASRASDAARETVARRTTTLPRRPAGHGAPGPAKEQRVQRLSDFNRGLKQRFGGA